MTTTPTLKATLYSLPDGATSTITITDVDPAEVEFFKHRPVSTEVLRNGQRVLYASSHAQDDDGFIEITCVVTGTVREGLKTLRSMTENIEALYAQHEEYPSC